jgi:hypothetical protein
VKAGHDVVLLGYEEGTRRAFAALPPAWSQLAASGTAVTSVRPSGTEGLMRAQDQEPVSTSRSQPSRTPSWSSGPVPLYPAAPLTAQTVLHLQRTVGNAVLARSIARQREAARANAQQVQRSAPATADRHEDQHAHEPGRGRDGAENSGPSGQRSLLDTALASPSRSLPDSLRAETEPFFHNDFSGVRLHDGPVAQRAAEAMGARAMTVGSHLFLPPGNTRNKALVGHEFSHLDKNLKGERETGTDNGAGVTVTDPAQRSERAAHTDGAAFAAGAATAPSVIAQRAATAPAGRSLHVQRAPGNSSDEFSDDGISEQDLARLSRTNFITALYEEFKKSGQWDLSSTQGSDEFTATKRPKKRSRPKSFTETPQVKQLRRVSTIVRTYLKNNGMNPVEVQAGIGDDDSLIIAANDANSNRHLQLQFNKGDGAQVLASMMEETRGKGMPPEGRNQKEIHDTAIRQHTKVKPRGDSPLNMPGIESALSSRVTVATDGVPGLHAERRIAARNGGTPRHLGGTKRPCPSCVAALYPEGNPEVHPGVFRSSDVANIGFPEYDHNDIGNEQTRAESMFQKINKMESTYVTVTKHGVEVPEIGTESDSDAN